MFDAAITTYNPELGTIDVETRTTYTLAIVESQIVSIQPFSTRLPKNGAVINGTIGTESLYRSIFTVSTDVTDQTRVPAIRFRTSSADFQQSDALVSSSVDVVDNTPTYSPTATPREYVQYFTQPAGQDQFRLDFDVMNFDPQDEPNALLQLDSVVIEALGTNLLTDAQQVGTIDFSSSATRSFEPRNASPAIAAPATLQPTNLGLLIRGVEPGAQPDGVTNPELAPTIFGFWGSEFTDFTLTPGRLYRIDWTVVSDASNAQREQIPVFRLRMNSSSLMFAAVLNIESRAGAVRVPVAGAPQTYSQYFLVPEDVQNEFMILSFDYLYSNGTDDDPTIALIRVHPVKGEYWDSPSSTALHLYGYVKAAVTGESPKPEQEKVDLRG